MSSSSISPCMTARGMEMLWEAASQDRRMPSEIRTHPAVRAAYLGG